MKVRISRGEVGRIASILLANLDWSDMVVEGELVEEKCERCGRSDSHVHTVQPTVIEELKDRVVSEGWSNIDTEFFYKINEIIRRLNSIH